MGLGKRFCLQEKSLIIVDLGNEFQSPDWNRGQMRWLGSVPPWCVWAVWRGSSHHLPKPLQVWGTPGARFASFKGQVMETQPQPARGRGLAPFRWWRNPWLHAGTQTTPLDSLVATCPQSLIFHLCPWQRLHRASFWSPAATPYS